MRVSHRWMIGVAAACAAHAGGALADEPSERPRYELTLDEALAMARERAPAMLAARARIDAARGELAYASLLVPANPTLDLDAGPRFGEDETTLDLDVGLGQTFALGGTRAARIDAAAAGVDLATARAESAERRALVEVARDFLHVVRAERLVEVARDARRIAAEVARTAEQRYRAGEAGILDVHLASLSVARADVRLSGLQAQGERARAAMRDRLALEPDAEVAVVPDGSFAPPEAAALEELLANVEQLPRLVALDAAIRREEAEVRRGEAALWPDLGLRIGYGREEEADIVRGGISLGLPVVDRGQRIEATARARGRALRVEHTAAAREARSRVRAAYEVHRALREAAVRFAREGLPRIEQGEELARRSYEAGAMQLADLLAVRRELVDARQDHVDVLFDAALARVELEAAAGVLR